MYVRITRCYHESALRDTIEKLMKFTEVSAEGMNLFGATIKAYRAVPNRSLH